MGFTDTMGVLWVYICLAARYVPSFLSLCPLPLSLFRSYPLVLLPPDLSPADSERTAKSQCQGLGSTWENFLPRGHLLALAHSQTALPLGTYLHFLPPRISLFYSSHDAVLQCLCLIIGQRYSSASAKPTTAATRMMVFLDNAGPSRSTSG